MLGERIGNYTIVRQIGSGGMGDVYLAVHEHIQTRIAVKVLFPHISRDRHQVERFFNEARAAAQILHAGIVKIYDVGFAGGGQAYLLMELLEGESLAARLERGRLDHRTLCEIGRQIASILAATHAAGIIHRDLKPDNIFLVPDHELASGERVKILDFGIAKLTGALAPKKATLSQSTMGTPLYMSPEQAGDASKVDARADIYSLGCIVFEMACGRPPFEATSSLEALAKHLGEAPPTARSLVPEVSPALDALVSRMLEKSPAARPQRASELVTAFADLGAGGSALVQAAAGAPTIRPVASPAAAPNVTTLKLAAKAQDLGASPRAKTPPLVERGATALAEVADRHRMADVPPPADASPAAAVIERPDAVASGSSPPQTAVDPESSTSITVLEPRPRARTRAVRPWMFLAIGGLLAVVIVVAFIAERGGARSSAHGAVPRAIDAGTVAAVRRTAVDAAVAVAPTPPSRRDRAVALNPFHAVTGQSFSAQRHQVSGAEYGLFLQDTPADRVGAMQPLDVGAPPTSPSAPIARIAFDQAVAYCRWAGGELPTDPQWSALTHDAAGGFAVGPLNEWTSTLDGDEAMARKPAEGEGPIWKTTRPDASPKQRARDDLGFRCVGPEGAVR